MKGFVRQSILRKAMALASLCVLSFSFTSVGSEQVTINWWVVNWNFDTRAVIEELIIPTFESRNPNIKVEVRYITWGNFSDTVAIAFASGTAPDILQRGANEIYTLAWEAQAIPLDPYLERWGQVDDFIPTTWNGVVTLEALGGKVYGLPSLTSPRLLYYRRDVFAELGFDPNFPPQSWDELLTISKRATRPKSDGGFEKVGFALAANNQQWVDFLRQNGGQVIDSSGRTFMFADTNGVEALEFYVDLYTSIRPPGAGWLPSGSPPLMASDHIAMGIAARTTALHIQREFPNELPNVDIAYPPGPVQQAATTYTDYWTITTQSKHPDEAWRFLEFLMEPEILVAYNQTMGFLPPRKSMITDPYVTEDRFARIFMESLLDGVALPMPVTPLGRQFEFILNEAVQKAVALEAAPGAILEDTQRLANVALEEIWDRIERNVVKPNAPSPRL